MNHFLLRYDRRLGCLDDLQVFTGADASSRAMRARFAMEAARSSSDLEIVVIQAESEQDLHRTHNRYFRNASELATAASVDVRLPVTQ